MIEDNGNHTFVVDNQLDGTIFELSEDQFKQVVIAYETGLGHWYRAGQRVQIKPKTCTASFEA